MKLYCELSLAECIEVVLSHTASEQQLPSLLSTVGFQRFMSLQQALFGVEHCPSNEM